MELHALNDMELWLQVQQNSDAAAFEALCRRYLKVLYSTIYKWVDNGIYEENILQEVFLDVWDRRRQVHMKGAFFNYVYAITSNKVFDHIKERKLNDRQLRAWGELNQTEAVEPDVQNHKTFPSEHLLHSELQELPAQMKQVY